MTSMVATASDAGPPRPSDQPSAPPSGRKAQSGRNDALILDAAREVFLRDPRAPISAVGDAAGVGISALYPRYPSKEHLLQKLCADGLRRYIEVAERSLTPELERWMPSPGSSPASSNPTCTR